MNTYIYYIYDCPAKPAAHPLIPWLNLRLYADYKVVIRGTSVRKCRVVIVMVRI